MTKLCEPCGIDPAPPTAVVHPPSEPSQMTIVAIRPVARLLSGEVLISHYRDHALFRNYTNAARGSGGTL